jgi:hypothetical protein
MADTVKKVTITPKKREDFESGEEFIKYWVEEFRKVMEEKEIKTLEECVELFLEKRTKNLKDDRQNQAFYGAQMVIACQLRGFVASAAGVDELDVPLEVGHQLAADVSDLYRVVRSDVKYSIYHCFGRKEKGCYFVEEEMYGKCISRHLLSLVNGTKKVEMEWEREYGDDSDEDENCGEGEEEEVCTVQPNVISTNNDIFTLTMYVMYVRKNMTQNSIYVKT